MGTKGNLPSFRALSCLCHSLLSPLFPSLLFSSSPLIISMPIHLYSFLYILLKSLCLSFSQCHLCLSSNVLLFFSPFLIITFFNFFSIISLYRLSYSSLNPVTRPSIPPSSACSHPSPSHARCKVTHKRVQIISFTFIASDLPHLSTLILRILLHLRSLIGGRSSIHSVYIPINRSPICPFQSSVCRCACLVKYISIALFS